MKQATRLRHREQSTDAHAASRLTEDCDIGGIAAELGDIVADPFERGDLIEDPFVAGSGNLSVGQIAQTQEAQRP